MTIRYNRDRTELTRGATDFGIRDNQNRCVGYAWCIFSVIYTPVPEGQVRGYIGESLPHPHLEIVAFPTRNGRHYGASGNDLQCLTMEEAEKLIAKRVEQARKRDTKKFNAVGEGR
jgi:hypothetical protein